MSKPTTLSVLLLAQRELREFYSRDSKSQALGELKDKIAELSKDQKAYVLTDVDGDILGVYTGDNKTVKYKVKFLLEQIYTDVQLHGFCIGGSFEMSCKENDEKREYYLTAVDIH